MWKDDHMKRNEKTKYNNIMNGAIPSVEKENKYFTYVISHIHMPIFRDFCMGI
jgi:hypothetical protein